MCLGLNSSPLRRNWRRVAGLIATLMTLYTQACPGLAEDAADRIVARSVVSPGDAFRLEHVLAKARRGEPVTVAVIGGSITAGARATTPEKTYSGVLAQWWRRSFPKTKVELVKTTSAIRTAKR